MKKSKITALLGPTNTGKTFLAIETMLSFESGMIGLGTKYFQFSFTNCKYITKPTIIKKKIIVGIRKYLCMNYYIETFK